MFSSIPSLDSVLQCLLPVFTQPSVRTHIDVFIGWVRCLGKRTEYGVFQTIQADTPVSRTKRHPFDRFYNFFSRSAWTVRDLAHEVAVAIVLALNPRGRFPIPRKRSGEPTAIAAERDRGLGKPSKPKPTA